MTLPTRRDPDLLLARMREQEARDTQGRLKIFMGASPGVGKTFAMLESAQAAHVAGKDVLVGVLETHGRKETARLLDGLEQLPHRIFQHRGITLDEFDLDAAIARHPSLLLVDELAHTNAPGSRHAKRWQDVAELLAAGIDVHTTLNIQHLESLNDVVAQITGVTVRETIPDSVLDDANEVELVDVSPEVLLQRLHEGKVYLPEQAKHALDRFFKRGNLIALRELALRRTAQQVDGAMLDWREGEGIDRAWPASERVLVAVAPTSEASRVVRSGWRLASALKAECIVLHIETTEVRRLAPAVRDQIQQALQLAEQLGARVTTVTGVDVGDELLDWARRENVTRVVVGRARHGGLLGRLRRSPVERLLAGHDGFDVHVVSTSEDRVVPVLIEPAQARLREYLASLAWVIGAGLAGLVVRDHVSTTDVAMIFLLAVAIAGARSRQGPGLAAAVLSIAVFDFGFVKPYYTFAVSDVSYFLTFVVMLGVAIAMSRLTSRIREQGMAARSRERRVAALLELAQELAQAREPEIVASAVARRISDSLGADVALLIEEPGSTLHPITNSTIVLDEKEMAVAQWAHSRRQHAGLGTSTLPAASARWLPLVVGDQSVGVLGVKPRDGDTLKSPERQHFLEAVAGQAAVALERLRLMERTGRDQVEIEAERLRTSLLSSLSHDLRTPLAAVEGSATTMLQTNAELSSEIRHELLTTIRDESRRMAGLVGKLLDMVKMESGALAVQREWQSLEEIVGMALLRMDNVIAPFKLVTELPSDLPMLRVDGLLLEQVLVNLIENATKYAPTGSTITIAAKQVRDMIETSVSDEGPGVPQGEEEKVFEKFYRAPGARGGGVGLGLAICRGIVTAHGGSIHVENRPEHGLRVVFTLPIPNEQPGAVPVAEG